MRLVLAAAITQGVTNPVQRVLRVSEQSLRCDDNDPPALPLQLLAALQIIRPLLTYVGVVTAVILDDELEGRIAQIEAPDPNTVRVTYDEVRPWFREAGKHNQHAQS